MSDFNPAPWPYDPHDLKRPDPLDQIPDEVLSDPRFEQAVKTYQGKPLQMNAWAARYDAACLVWDARLTEDEDRQKHPAAAAPYGVRRDRVEGRR